MPSSVIISKPRHGGRRGIIREDYFDVARNGLRKAICGSGEERRRKSSAGIPRVKENVAVIVSDAVDLGLDAAADQSPTVIGSR